MVLNERDLRPTSGEMSEVTSEEPRFSGDFAENSEFGETGDSDDDFNPAAPVLAFEKRVPQQRPVKILCHARVFSLARVDALHSTFECRFDLYLAWPEQVEGSLDRAARAATARVRSRRETVVTIHHLAPTPLSTTSTVCKIPPPNPNCVRAWTRMSFLRIIFPLGAHPFLSTATSFVAACVKNPGVHGQGGRAGPTNLLWEPSLRFPNAVTHRCVDEKLYFVDHERRRIGYPRRVSRKRAVYPHPQSPCLPRPTPTLPTPPTLLLLLPFEQCATQNLTRWLWR